MEDGSDRWIKLNNFVSFHCHLQVALLDLLINPLLEVLADEAVDHVADETPFELHDFFPFGECILYMGVLASEVEDPLHGEASVVGHVDGPDVVQVDGQFLVREDVFQEGYLHGLYRRQV